MTPEEAKEIADGCAMHMRRIREARTWDELNRAHGEFKHYAKARYVCAPIVSHVNDVTYREAAQQLGVRLSRVGLPQPPDRDAAQRVRTMADGLRAAHAADAPQEDWPVADVSRAAFAAMRQATPNRELHGLTPASRRMSGDHEGDGL